MESKLNIIQAFETFTDSHGQIQRFHFEFEEQLNQFATADTGYPILYIVPLDDGSTQQLTDYGFRVYCFDIIDKDRSNLKFAYNNTNLIVQDFLRYFDNSNSEISTFTIISKGNIQPLNNQLVDYCVGCYVDVYFQVEGVSLCDIPFIDGIPTITTHEQLEINQLLTCNNLGSCSTFTDAIDNLQNEIDNIVDENYFTTGATLSGNILTFDRTDELDAYSVDLSSLDSPTPPLSDVLLVGNTTGGNNIVLSDGDVISATSGNGQLDLRAYNTDNNISLSNDAGEYFIDNEMLLINHESNINIISENLNIGEEWDRRNYIEDSNMHNWFQSASNYELLNTTLLGLNTAKRAENISGGELRPSSSGQGLIGNQVSLSVVAGQSVRYSFYYKPENTEGETVGVWLFGNSPNTVRCQFNITVTTGDFTVISPTNITNQSIIATDIGDGVYRVVMTFDATEEVDFTANHLAVTNNTGAGIFVEPFVELGTTSATLNKSINLGFNNELDYLNSSEKVIVIGSDINQSVESGKVYIKNANLLGDVNLDTIGSTTPTTILATDTNGNIVDGSTLLTSSQTLAQTLATGDESDGNLNITSGVLSINNFDFDGSYLKFNNADNSGEIAGLYTAFNDLLILYNDDGKLRLSASEDVEINSSEDINLTPGPLGTPGIVNVTGDLDVSQEVTVGIERWTIDLTEALDYTLYATESLEITEIDNIVGTPTITILVNDVTYTLGNAIVSGDKIDIISDIQSVIKLKIEK